MSKKFYKDVHIIAYCKICSVEFRPKRYGYRAALCVCNVHLREFLKKRYAEYGREYEKKPERKKMRFEVWKKWVKKNIEHRRKLALESYHRRKFDPKNRSRKHRKSNLCKNEI